MANDQHDAFSNQLNALSTTFKNDLLPENNKDRWPRKIEFVAGEIHDDGYLIGIKSRNETRRLGVKEFSDVAPDYYLSGIQALTDTTAPKNELKEQVDIGDLLLSITDLNDSLEAVDSDIPTGEVLARLTTRDLQRQTGEKSRLADYIDPNVNTAHQLVAQMANTPKIAGEIQSALPSDMESGETLTDRLGRISMTTELWDHQVNALANWIDDGMMGYVDMATATGKTVLGLAAIAHALDIPTQEGSRPLGELHPSDKEKIKAKFEGDIPTPDSTRPKDVLIVTTDNLLAVQWARLFQEHCQTPPEYTKIDNQTITLPNLEIDIRAADSLDDIDPADYRIAIFDEVHNYGNLDKWGKPLKDCIDSECPVLALTGSVTDEIETLDEQTDNDFTSSFTYTHEQALDEGIIPEFEWTLTYTTDKSDTNAAQRFRETARLATERLQITDDRYAITPDTLRDTDPSLTDNQLDIVEGEYKTPTEVATVLRKAGELDEDKSKITDYTKDTEAPTDELETLAHGLEARTFDRINLQSEIDIAETIAELAMDQDKATLILTKSYDQAKELWQALYDRNGTRKVKRLKQGESSEVHADEIQLFDNWETNRKILIAPGKTIGQGNDIETVEVGINLPKEGNGINTSLIQRLGRLLRNPDNKDGVEFHHVQAIPDAEAVLPTDGKSYLSDTVECFAQAIEPDVDGIVKPPHVIVKNEVKADLCAIEEIGNQPLQDKPTTEIEDAYINAINNRVQGHSTESPTPTVTEGWFEAYCERKEIDIQEHTSQTALGKDLVRCIAATSESTTPAEDKKAEHEKGDQSVEANQPEEHPQPEDADIPNSKHTTEETTQPSEQVTTVETAESNTDVNRDGDMDVDVYVEEKPNTNANEEINSDSDQTPETNTDSKQMEDNNDDIDRLEVDWDEDEQQHETDTQPESPRSDTSDASDSETTNQMANDADMNHTETGSPEGKSVTVDKATAALVAYAARTSATKYETTEEFVTAALDPFVRSIINRSIDIEGMKVGPANEIDVETSPEIQQLLSMKVDDSDDYTDTTQIILDGILSQLDVENVDTKITVPHYNKYELSLDELIQSDQAEPETPGEVVQVAIRSHLNI